MQKAKTDISMELNATQNIRNDLIKKRGFKRKGKEGHTIPDPENSEELEECEIDKDEALKRLKSFQEEFKQALDSESSLVFPVLTKTELSGEGVLLSANDIGFLKVDFIVEE